MSLFGGLFGHDKIAARASGAYSDPSQLPTIPFNPEQNQLQGDMASGFTVPGASTQPLIPPKLPTPPPRPAKRAGAFDDDHYRQTMLAMAAGFFGSQNFGDGMGKAAQAIYQGNADAQKAGKPAIGGPDDAFEVYTDPQSGKHTYVPIQAAMDYKEKARIKAKDTADLNGRAMHAIMQMDPAERPAAFAELKGHPEYYGVDASLLPAAWDDRYGNVIGNMGMTVGQSIGRQQQGDRDAVNAAGKAAAQADRETRTGIMSGRAATATRQGDERIGIAREALGIRKNGGASKAPVSSMSTADLLALIGK